MQKNNTSKAILIILFCVAAIVISTIIGCVSLNNALPENISTWDFFRYVIAWAVISFLLFGLIGLYKIMSLNKPKIKPDADLTGVLINILKNVGMDVNENLQLKDGVKHVATVKGIITIKKDDEDEQVLTTQSVLITLQASRPQPVKQ